MLLFFSWSFIERSSTVGKEIDAKDMMYIFKLLATHLFKKVLKI